MREENNRKFKEIEEQIKKLGLRIADMDKDMISMEDRLK